MNEKSVMWRNIFSQLLPFFFTCLCVVLHEMSILVKTSIRRLPARGCRLLSTVTSSAAVSGSGLDGGGNDGAKREIHVKINVTS